jgi:ABC-type sugar transport system permease subunit
MSPILYIYQQAFQNFDFGVAAAAGVVFLGVILLLTIAQWFTFGRQDAA